jgi:hypothetical protein
MHFFYFRDMTLLRHGLLVRHDVGHHAPNIRLRDLDSSIALSLESHRHLRISTIDSIVAEFPAAIEPSPSRSVSLLYPTPSTCTSCRDNCCENFPISTHFLLSEPSFRFSIVILCCGTLCRFVESNSFLTWLIRWVVSSMPLSSGTSEKSSEVLELEAEGHKAIVVNFDVLGISSEWFLYRPGKVNGLRFEPFFVLCSSVNRQP